MLPVTAFRLRGAPSKLNDDRVGQGVGVGVRRLVPVVVNGEQSVCTGLVAVLPNWPVCGQFRVVGSVSLCWMAKPYVSSAGTYR